MVAVSALQNSNYIEARESFYEILKKRPYSLKVWIHYLFVRYFPTVAKAYYGR
jgi:hypothetical protein